MSEWISVKDRLPNLYDDSCSENVFICDDDDGEQTVCEGWYCYLGGDIQWNSHVFGYDLNVTHWMPLPEPPKEGE